MSDIIATYSFLPWLREGIANSITQGDHDNTVKLRASVNVRLTVASTKVNGSAGTDQVVENNVQLYGPGDVIGLDSKLIIKTEPHNWITNFEPNYFPYIDFYDEGVPWWYAPACPSGERLRPWLTLVVLKEDEFENGKNAKDKPLPFFKMRDGKKAVDIFPNPAELWAWAHVHVNKDLSDGAEANTASPALVNAAIDNLITQHPDNAYSRIICPRKLESNVGYHAFLIPTFESGRLAGLGYDLPDDLTATVCGWDSQANAEFPYYYRWFFKTGDVGDFEYLVSLLQPKPADKKVGVRDMDVLHPGANLPKIDNPDLNGILKLGGALRVPFDTMLPPDKAEVVKYDQWDEHPYPHKFTEAMAARINIADGYTDVTKSIEEVNKNANIVSETDDSKGDPDPVITSPLYGRWHALQQRLLKERNGTGMAHNKNWVHELNLDPRFRVAAGLGTKVLQKNQEEYMQAAWLQVGKIVEANNRLRFAQLATQVSLKWYDKHLVGLPTEKAFVFTTPVQKRVVDQYLTIYKQVQDSMVPTTVSTGAFRSAARPGGPVMKKLFGASVIVPDAIITSGNLIERINNGEVIVAPPRVDPKGAINLSDITAKLQPTGIPAFIKELLQKHKWFKYLPLIILLIILLIVLFFFMSAAGIAILGVSAAILGWIYKKFADWDKAIKLAEIIDQNNEVPSAIDAYPTSSNFVISQPGSGFQPSFGGSDSAEAKRYKAALKDAFTMVNIKFPDPVRKKLDLAGLTKKMVEKLNPVVTIPGRIYSNIKIPDRLWINMKEKFAPVMAYPEIDFPMYKPLAGLSSELFLPNINLIEQNSITLLENNQKFIESYMVGVNHEMSRELLWREYPTDQRGTYFRQFWSVDSFLPPQPVPPDIKEQLRDIPRIHRWSKINTVHTVPGDTTSPLKNELGQHNQRALQSGKTQLVLVIRGELLKKYPTAVIYAQKADWGVKESTHAKDIKEERTLIEITEDPPPANQLKTPLFEAKVDPDIYFFGFDLDDEEARGTLHPTSTADDPGWFFVIKERPGEPRFGLDIERTKKDNVPARLTNWNNLAWPDVGTPDGSCIKLEKTIPLVSYSLPTDGDNKDIKDDVQARWYPGTNAAQLAYILYQVPVLVAVHASRMLPK